MQSRFAVICYLVNFFETKTYFAAKILVPCFKREKLRCHFLQTNGIFRNFFLLLQPFVIAFQHGNQSATLVYQSRENTFIVSFAQVDKGQVCAEKRLFVAC